MHAKRISIYKMHTAVLYYTLVLHACTTACTTCAQTSVQACVFKCVATCTALRCLYTCPYTCLSTWSKPTFHRRQRSTALRAHPTHLFPNGQEPPLEENCISVFDRFCAVASTSRDGAGHSGLILPAAMSARMADTSKTTFLHTRLCPTWSSLLANMS